MALAAVTAAALAAPISTAGLTAVFATVVAVARILMAAAGDWGFRDMLPARPIQTGLAGSVGWFSAWMGIGAGTLGVPTLAAMNTAVGTTALLLGAFVPALALAGWLWSISAAPSPARRPPMSSCRR